MPDWYTSTVAMAFNATGWPRWDGAVTDAPCNAWGRLSWDAGAKAFLAEVTVEPHVGGGDHGGEYHFSNRVALALITDHFFDWLEGDGRECMYEGSSADSSEYRVCVYASMRQDEGDVLLADAEAPTRIEALAAAVLAVKENSDA